MSDAPSTAADPTALREALARPSGEATAAAWTAYQRTGELSEALAAGMAIDHATLLDRLAKAEEERDEARTAIEAVRGPTVDDVAAELGQDGRRMTLDKHVAANFKHVAKVIADLDTRGLTEASETLLWAQWWRENERSWTKYLREHSTKEMYAAHDERDALQAQVARLEKRIKALETGEQGDVCPFSGPPKAWAHIGVNDPCPVCGDLGTLASADKPSSCPDMQRSRPARAALKTQEAEHG